MKKKVKSLWCWVKDNSDPFVAIGTILLALATFLHIEEAKEMRIQTKNLTDLTVKEFQMRAYPAFLVNWGEVYVKSENLFQHLAIHNKGEITAHGVTFLIVNTYEDKNNKLCFVPLTHAYRKDKPWMTIVNFETKIFKDGRKELISKKSFPQNHSIETLKHALLYVKFKIPYDDKPHFESFGYFLKKDFTQFDSANQYYAWQEIDINLKNFLIKKTLEVFVTSQAEGMEIVKAFFEGYHATQEEFKN